MSEDYTIDAFIGDVKRILAEDGENHAAFERIQEKMQVLVKNPEYTEIDEEAEAGNIHSGRQSRPLYEDERTPPVATASATPATPAQSAPHNGCRPG